MTNMKCLTRRSEGFGLLLLVAMVSLLSSSYSAFGYENDKAISKLVEADESIFEAFEMLLRARELWRYDSACGDFQYHNRFVGFWLNATG